MLEHQRDLMADFRVFYRMAPAEAMELPGPEWLALAHRASAYSGVIRIRAEEQDRRQERTRARRGVRQVDSTPEAIGSDPLLAGAISFG